MAWGFDTHESQGSSAQTQSSPSHPASLGPGYSILICLASSAQAVFSCLETFIAVIHLYKFISFHSIVPPKIILKNAFLMGKDNDYFPQNVFGSRSSTCLLHRFLEVWPYLIHVLVLFREILLASVSKFGSNSASVEIIISHPD